uniref:Uncharacterized protein n=1 Tax=Anguilla anguilla TaxID=7936 RepID=A0A0E9XP65_ANGAN
MHTHTNRDYRMFRYNIKLSTLLQLVHLITICKKGLY